MPSTRNVTIPPRSKITQPTVDNAAPKPCIFVRLIILRHIPNSIWNTPTINDTYNMATGLLGDVLSYIRLFALGLSGSILGLVFNDLAMNMKPDIPIIGTIVMLLILVFGHAMNIALSALSAFVHPMRLTFVEFYKNSGFVGGAKEYEPFKRS